MLPLEPETKRGLTLRKLEIRHGIPVARDAFRQAWRKRTGIKGTRTAHEHLLSRCKSFVGTVCDNRCVVRDRFYETVEGRFLYLQAGVKHMCVAYVKLDILTKTIRGVRVVGVRHYGGSRVQGTASGPTRQGMRSI